MNAAERAVREERDGVAGPRVSRDALEDGVDARGRERLLVTDLVREAREIEPLRLRYVRATERREEHPIGDAERRYVLVLVQRAARRGAAGLEDGPQRSSGM